MGHQSDMAQVVGTELQLETVLGGLVARRVHYPSVVDQDVDWAALGDQRRTEVGD